jgi:hypothetical protein
LTFSKIADSSQYILRTSASVTLMVSKIDETLFKYWEGSGARLLSNFQYCKSPACQVGSDLHTSRKTGYSAMISRPYVINSVASRYEHNTEVGLVRKLFITYLMDPLHPVDNIRTEYTMSGGGASRIKQKLSRTLFL